MKILISFACDVKEKTTVKSVVENAVERFNHGLSDVFNVRYICKYWEDNTYPQLSGAEPQTIINQQFADSCDMIIAVLWTRFGTPTTQYASGTEEEIYRKRAEQKSGFIYRLQKPIAPTDIDMPQLRKVNSFFFKIGKNSLYTSINNETELYDKVYDHLIRFTKDNLRNSSLGTIQNSNGLASIHYKSFPPISESEFISSKTIKILSTSANTFFRQYKTQLQQAYNNGAVIQVLFATPNSEFVKEVMEMQRNPMPSYPFSPYFNDINKEISINEGTLCNIVTDNGPGKISLGHFNTHFRANMIIFDTTAYYTPILPPKLSSEVISFKLTKGEIYNDCLLHFDTIYSLLDKKGNIKRL